MVNKQKVTAWISLASVPLAILWFALERGIEPIIVGLFGINSVVGQGLPWKIRKYATLRKKGTVSFNFNKNDNKYEFGEGKTYFETQWASSSASSIQALSQTPSVKHLAVVTDKAYINEISDATAYEFTSHERPQKGEILLLENRFGNFAALKIVKIKDRSRNADRDELTVEYVINQDRDSDFRE